MANIALNKPSGGQLILSPEDGTSTETVTIPSVGVGKVLQVVQFTNDQYIGVTGNSTSDIWYDAVTATITPTSSTSKILVMMKLTMGAQADGGYDWGARLLRNGTPIGGNNNGLMRQDNIISTSGYAGSESATTISAEYLDSPSSTSQVTYKLQGAGWESATYSINRSYRTDQTGYNFSNSADSSIILMEVAA